MPSNSMSLPFDAVLFDCDGVLVDSEPITARVLTAALQERGWPITFEETQAIFTGKAVRDQADLIAARTGKPFSHDWLMEFWARRNLALEAELEAIPGALDSVREVHAATQARIAVGSGADFNKVVMQLKKTHLFNYFEGRIFSGHDMPRSKPYPDVYLAAAQALQVDPRRCAVIEDTVTGAAAGIAAGATVLGYSPGGPGHSTSNELLKVGVQQVFHHMQDLPRVLASCRPG